MPVNLREVGKTLSDGWHSLVVGQVYGVDLKLFKLDSKGLPMECHPAYDEGLLVIEGALQLEVDGLVFGMRAGDYHTIPAGSPHRILPGCSGTMLLFDPEILFAPRGAETKSPALAAGVTPFGRPPE